MAKSERHLYTPGTQPPAMHVKMVDWQFRIAEAVEKDLGIDIVKDIKKDYANYSYPTFAGQAMIPWRQFYRYYRDLSKLGLGRHPTFHAWFWAISLLGIRNVDRIVMAIRKRVGHTPNFSRLPRAPRPSVA